MKNCGLTFKPKWRLAADGQWHCFLRHGSEHYSGCGRYVIKPGAIGSICNRPPVHLRCGLCDGRECDLYQRDESMPQSPNWTG